MWTYYVTIFLLLLTIIIIALLGDASSLLVKLNMVDLNRQAKLYSQGMVPVYKILPGKPHWERIKDRPVYNVCDINCLPI